jgi:hypothetical protein
MNSVKQLVTARWFPTVTKPLLSALLAMGVVYGLHALGITSFTTWEVNNAVTPFVGFLVAAIVQQENKPTPAPTPGPPPAPSGPSVGSQIAGMLVDSIGQAIDTNPSLVHDLATKALEQAAHPAQTVLVIPQDTVTTGNEVSHS